VANPKDVLSADEYSNYRNIRAVSLLFAILGSLLVFGGTVGAIAKNPDPRNQLPVAAAVCMVIVGLTAAVGGVAARRGSRRLAPLVYVMAALYVFGFPVGTILSIVMFRGLSRYLGSMELLKARAQEPAPSPSVP
jgi:hypothetical protein